MTLVSSIIRDAYRESNLIAISANPTTAEQEEGLALLNRFIRSVYGTDAGEQLNPIAIGRNNIDRPQGWPWYETVPDDTEWFVPENTRLMLNMTQPQSVWLTPAPDDGARFAFNDLSDNLSSFPLTIHGNGRLIEGADDFVANTDSEVREYIYRADTGNWAVVTPLADDDDMPFPEDFDDLFAIGLAMRLNPRHAVQADQQSVAVFNRLMRLFKARYRQHQEVGSELALVRTLGNQNRYYDDTRYGNSLFNSGWGNPYWGLRW